MCYPEARRLGIFFTILYGSCDFFFFFFSSRRRHTRCLSDWSSDVCSSDLAGRTGLGQDALDDLGREADIGGWVEQRFQLFGAQCACHLRILHEGLAERDALGDRKSVV